LLLSLVHPPTVSVLPPPELILASLNPQSLILSEVCLTLKGVTTTSNASAAAPAAALTQKDLP